MSKCRSFLSGYLAAGLLLGGCGSADTTTTGATSFQPSVPAAGTLASEATTRLSGRVVSESGEGVSGVQMVVSERTTDVQYEAVSGPAGAYSVQVPPGVYDVGLLSEETQTAVCFYGPISVSSEGRQDFELKSAAGRTADQLFGRVTLRPGQAAANRIVAVVPRTHQQGPNEAPLARAETTTDASGAFAISVGSSGVVGLDVELCEANGRVDEWVDVYKMANKPCYVELASEESPVENRLHCAEGDLPANDALLGRLPDKKFVASTFDNGKAGRLSDGKIVPGKRQERPRIGWGDLFGSGSWPDSLRQLLSSAPATPPGDSWIQVDDDGWGWFKWNFGVTVCYGCSFRFVDEDGGPGGTYILDFLGGEDANGQRHLSYHYTSYNSDKPAIVRIDLWSNDTGASPFRSTDGRSL